MGTLYNVLSGEKSLMLSYLPFSSRQKLFKVLCADALALIQGLKERNMYLKCSQLKLTSSGIYVVLI